MPPQSQYAPAKAPQPTEMSEVAPASAGDLGFPVGRQFLAPQREAPAVPEIAVHEHYQPFFDEHEVRLARQLGDVPLADPAARLEGRVHRSFQRRVAALDRTHRLATVFRT